MITNIQQWAENRNTDLRVALEIAHLADGDETEAERIWDEPTEHEAWTVFDKMIHESVFSEYGVPWGDKTLGDILDGFL